MSHTATAVPQHADGSVDGMFPVYSYRIHPGTTMDGTVYWCPQERCFYDSVEQSMADDGYVYGQYGTEHYAHVLTEWSPVMATSHVRKDVMRSLLQAGLDDPAISIEEHPFLR